MMQQTSLLSSRFAGGIIGRKAKHARRVAPCRERFTSSRGDDLLEPASMQRVSSQKDAETKKGILQIIAAQTDYNAVSLEEHKSQVIIEEPQPPAAESLVELLHSLEESPKFAGLHKRNDQRPFQRLLSENSKRIIGENGLYRFEEFKRYPRGWDGGHGKPLSHRSITSLETFLRQLPELAIRQPSLFLTHQGNLQLGWEDKLGNVVELEFFPDKVEYYLESLNEEGMVDLKGLHLLVDKVGSTIS